MTKRMKRTMRKTTKMKKSPEPSRSDARLAVLRKKIDGLDVNIVRLLNQRTSAAVEIGRIKHQLECPVFSPARESEVLKRVAGSSQGPLRAAELRAIYREIMSAALAFEGGLQLAVLKRDGLAVQAAARYRFGDGAVRKTYSSLAALRRANRPDFLLVSAKWWKTQKATGWRVCETFRHEDSSAVFVLLIAEAES